MRARLDAAERVDRLHVRKAGAQAQVVDDPTEHAVSVIVGCAARLLGEGRGKVAKLLAAVGPRA